MTELTWTIISLEVAKLLQDLPNVVVNVFWQYTATNGVDRVFLTGSTSLLPPDAASFVQLNRVTKQQLISWIEQAQDMSALNAQLNQLLQTAMSNPTYITPFVGS